MSSQEECQLAQAMPPRRGSVMAITVDSTARPYDLSALAFGDAAPEASLKGRKQVVLWMQAETNDVYFYFHTATANDLADTSKVSAASPAVFDNAYGAVLKAGNAPVKIRIDRYKDRWLVLKAASTAGVLRFWAGSDEE